MTLELSKVAAQISAMGENAAQRASDRKSILPVVRSLLAEHATNAALRDKVEAAIKSGWDGAMPAREPLDAAFEPPALPPQFAVVATDGSQIYPDRHGLALYYVINVGSIVLRLGTGETPLTGTHPLVCFEADQIFDDDQNVVSSQLVNARRAVQEIAQLAQLAVNEAPHAPTIALSDANIALRVKQAGIPGAEGQQLEEDYIRQLDRLRDAHVAMGGFVSRPGATSVIRLLQLATYPPDEVAERLKNKSRPFGGVVNDTALFENTLEVGQRSAIFELTSQWGKPYKDAGHAIHFFYMKVSSPPQTDVVRIEIPEWMASDPERIGLLHAAIVDQCRITSKAYPYVLTRADELAVITTAEKTRFEQMIGVELLRHGIATGPSEKAATKAFARYGKGR
jgi:hypothetical protein